LQNAVIEQNDYLPFGTRVPIKTSSSNLYRYNGKEEQQIAGTELAVLDYGARTYDPWLSRWTSIDPLAAKYYSTSPYVFCNNSPVNFVDLDGRSWYYNSSTGDFISHIDDDDDYIYLITPDQIETANGDEQILSSFRSDFNMLGQLALDGLLDDSIACKVVYDLYSRANTTSQGKLHVDQSVNVVIDNIMSTDAQVIRDKNTNVIIRLEVKPSSIFKGYDSILLFAHEVGHMIDIISNTVSADKLERERLADRFAKKHWVYQKASVYAKDKINRYENQRN
jgi:RHS repeat-associated protein